jgi:hypothetical protein
VATQLELVNKSLSLLGEGLLTSGQLTTPDDDTSRTVVAMLDTARRGMLRDSRPNCARKYAFLVATLPEPVNPDFLFAYDLPADCLRAIRVLAVEPEAPVIEGIGAPLVSRWRVGGRVIFLDIEDPALEYIADIPETDFDPLVDEAFAYYLAWQLAYPLTESRTMAADMQEQYLIAQQRMQVTDENEGQVDRVDQAWRLTGVRR